MNCKGCEGEIDQEKYESTGLCIACEEKITEIIVNILKGEES